MVVDDSTLILWIANQDAALYSCILIGYLHRRFGDELSLLAVIIESRAQTDELIALYARRARFRAASS